MTVNPEIQDRIDKCRKILEEDPSSQIFAALAEALRKKGELDTAFRVCQNGLKIHPDYGSAHIVMAKINLDRGQYDWAEIETKKAAEIDGHTRAIELLLSEIFIYKGQFKLAIKLLIKLHDADPDNEQIKKLLEIARQIPEEARPDEPTQITSPSPGSVIVRSMGSTSSPSAVAQPQVAGTGTAQAAVLEMLSPKELLMQSITIPGVDGALFINFEGLVVDTEWSLSLDHTVCGAVIGSVGKQVEQELIENSFGAVKTVLIESGSLTFYLIKVEEGMFLFVANSTANLGSIRMRIEKLMVGY